MPRLLHRPPKYAHHKGTGQAYVKVNGKRKYLGKYGSPESHAAYRAFLAGRREPVEKPAIVATPASFGAVMYIGECVARYQEHARTYYVKAGKPTSEVSVIKAALQPLLDHCKGEPVSKFGPKRLKQVRDAMVARRWCRRTVNGAVSIIVRCLSWCASEELIDASIPAALREVKGLAAGRTAAHDNPPVEPVSDDVVNKTLPHLPDVVADVIRVMCLTGMRSAEVLSLTGDRLDRRDPTCWWYDVPHHKTIHRGGARLRPIGPKAQEIILPRLLKAGNDERVFGIRPAVMHRAIDRACDQIGIAHWNPHQLRHAASTEAREREDLETAAAVIGDEVETSKIYAKQNLDKAAEYMRKFG